MARTLVDLDRKGGIGLEAAHTKSTANRTIGKRRGAGRARQQVPCPRRPEHIGRRPGAIKVEAADRKIGVGGGEQFPAATGFEGKVIDVIAPLDRCQKIGHACGQQRVPPGRAAGL